MWTPRRERERRACLTAARTSQLATAACNAARGARNGRASDRYRLFTETSIRANTLSREAEGSAGSRNFRFLGRSNFVDCSTQRLNCTIDVVL